MNYKHAGIKENELKKLVGKMNQLAGVRESILTDGRGQGLKVADVNNGSGLLFTILMDRGMDISHASFKGVPLAWISPVEFCHPSYYENKNIEWLRSWGAGLLTGCGLSNVGAPNDEMNLGLHGRLSHIPSEKCSVETGWKNSRYCLSVSGEMREARLFGENLVIRRTISTAMGENSIEIKDVLSNEGVRPSPCMILYHINLGFPLLSPDSEIRSGKHGIQPRDEEAAKGLNNWSKCSSPKNNFKEQCFYHDIPEDIDGFARCSLFNPDLGLDFEVAYRKKELPFLTQWKMIGESEYVLGLEPANCHVEGQIREKDFFKTLRQIKPGEKIEFALKMTLKESH